MQSYEDRMREAAKTAAMGAGATGLGIGALSAILAGKRRAALIARDAVLAGLGAGGLSGGGTYLGSKLLGPGAEDDPGKFTRRGAVGVGLGGGIGGALLGGLAGGGAVPAARLPNNLVGDYMKRLAARRSLSGVLKGAGLGAAALGTLGAYLGASEGMGVDFIQNERRRQDEGEPS